MPLFSKNSGHGANESWRRIWPAPQNGMIHTIKYERGIDINSARQRVKGIDVHSATDVSNRIKLLELSICGSHHQSSDY